MKIGKMIAASMVLAVLMVAASNAALVVPSIESSQGAIVGDGTFKTALDSSLTPLTGELVGISKANDKTTNASNRYGGYINTNGVSIANANEMEAYTLEVYVGNNEVGALGWDSGSQIGFFLDGATIANETDLSTAMDAFYNDADVTYTVGVPTTAQATPGANSWEKWTYTFTVADNGGNVYGSDLQFAARWNITTAYSSFYIDTIPEPATLGMITAMGGGLLFVRRRLMM